RARNHVFTVLDSADRDVARTSQDRRRHLMHRCRRQVDRAPARIRSRRNGPRLSQRQAIASRIQGERVRQRPDMRRLRVQPPKSSRVSEQRLRSPVRRTRRTQLDQLLNQPLGCTLLAESSERLRELGRLAQLVRQRTLQGSRRTERIGVEVGRERGRGTGPLLAFVLAPLLLAVVRTRRLERLALADALTDATLLSKFSLRLGQLLTRLETIQSAQSKTLPLLLALADRFL